MKPFSTHGAFSWCELQTSDLDTSAQFYKNVFSWDLESMDMPMGKYFVGSISGSPVAGIMDRQDPDSPGFWCFYVTSDDVDTSMSKAVELGATELMAAYDVPEIGRMGVIMDPQGAVLCIIKYSEPEHEAHQTEYESSYATHGAFSWFELRVPHATAAIAFYSSVFGWDIVETPMAAGPYNTVKVNGIGMGGIMSVPPDETPPHWGAYVTVTDADACAKRVTENHGTILYGPSDIPEVGRFVLFNDPQGNALAAIQYIVMPAQ